MLPLAPFVNPPAVAASPIRLFFPTTVPDRSPPVPPTTIVLFSVVVCPAVVPTFRPWHPY